LLITFSRIFFRAANIQDAFIVVKKVLHPSGSIFSQGASILVYASVALGILLTKEIKNEFFPNAVTLSNHPNFWMKNSYYAMLIILILTIGVFDGGQFIYFQF
jgi:hypothetical protein